MNKRVTIKDLAKYTGFSIATISLVLNNNATSIPDSVKEIIRKAAKELHYVPNFTARSLVCGTSKTIGIIIPDLSNTFFSTLVYHIQIELNKYDYEIILCNSDEKMENDIKYIQLLSSRGVDAMILALSAESMQEANRDLMKRTLDDLFVPFIFIDRFFDYDANIIMVDNYQGGFEVTKKLFEYGHKNIGFITGPLSLNSSINRLNGATDFLKSVGIEVSSDLVYEGKYDYDTGYFGASKLLQNNISAIFAFNDIQAYGVIGYASEHGIRIPEDVSLLGFDNLETSRMITPRLSTVEQPIDELSIVACKILLEILDNKECNKETKLSTRLILRDSIRRIDNEE